MKAVVIAQGHVGGEGLRYHLLIVRGQKRLKGVIGATNGRSRGSDL